MTHESLNYIACEELSKLFRVAEHSDCEMTMWSELIDKRWHELDGKPGYKEFCLRACGYEVIHAPTKGSGKIEWISHYEALFGELPEIWFRGLDGEVDNNLLEHYRRTGTVYASWDCGPLKPTKKNVPDDKDDKKEKEEK